jgi:cleavage stimulation factor subunit 2
LSFFETTIVLPGNSAFITKCVCISTLNVHRALMRLQDHDTAMSAVRNLNGQEVGGRPLRIDLADSDPFLEGKTTVRGELVDSQETRAQWRERERERERENRYRDPKAFLQDLPPGVAVPPGKTAGDVITEVLATTPPSQIFEVLAQMKASL